MQEGEEQVAKDGEEAAPPVETVEEDNKEVDRRPKLCCSVRFLFTVICFTSIFNLSFLRVGVSMALVCIELPGKADSVTWSSATKGYLISAAFYGFMFGPFVSGILSYKFGGKITLMVGTLGSGLLHFILPLGIATVPVFFTIRVLIGFLGGFTFPALYDLFSHWIVPEERQLLVTAALVGMPTANILNYPVSGAICHLLGWTWLFYSFGIWLILCSIFCFLGLYNYPRQCPFISKREREYIEKRIPQIVKLKIPWRAIMKSLPIHAYVIIHFCLNFYYLSLVLSLPMILESIYRLPLTYNGILSAVPFSGSLIVRIIMSLCFERIRRKLNVTKNALRKAFVFLGVVVSTLFLLIVTFVYEYMTWLIFCYLISSSFLELCLTGGYLLSLLDLCPPYVNVLTGVTNTIGNAAGLISPVVIGLITTHGSTFEWSNVMYVNITILLGAMTFYLVFGQNEIQPWALPAMLRPITSTRPSLFNNAESN